MSTPLRLTAAVLLCLPLSALGAEGAKATFEVLSLPDEGIGFAIHPERGTLAVLGSNGREVVLYPDLVSKRKTDKGKTLEVGRKSSEIVFKKVGKKNFFLVLATQDKALFVLDADKDEVVKKIPLRLEYLRNLAVSRNPNDPHVYYCGGGGHDCRIARVDLEKLADEGILSGAGTVSRAEISGDGSILYPHGPWSPSGFKALAIVPPAKEGEPASARALHYEHTSAGWFLPDPFGQYVISAGKVYSPDLKRVLATVTFGPQFISEVRPLMVSQQTTRAIFLSANTFEQVGSVELPAAFQKKVNRFLPRTGPRSTFLEHTASETLLLCRGRDIALLSLDKAGLPREPFLAFTAEGPDSLTVGQPQTVELRLRDPSVKVEIKDGPGGLRLDEHQLVWTPGPGDVGSHTVRLKLSAGKLAVTRELSLKVRRPAVDLPFIARQMAVSEDGSTALVLGREDPTAAGRRPSPGTREQLVRLALVDLKDMAIRAERKLLVPVRTAALDEHHVYVAAAASEAFYVLDRKDLSDVKRIFTNGRVRALIPVAGNLLFVATDTNQLQVLKVPPLRLAEPGEVGVGVHLAAKGASRSKDPPIRVGPGWWYDGCLYDADLAKPLALVRPAGFWPNRPAAPIDSFPPFPRAPRRENAAPPSWTSPWAVTLERNGFRHGKRFVPTTTASAGSALPSVMTVLTRKPAVAALRVTANTATGSGRIKVALSFYDLIAGGMSQEVPLREGPLTTQDYVLIDRFGTSPLHLVERSGKLVAACGPQLFAVSLPPLPADKFNPPMHFLARQKVHVLGDKAASLPLPKVEGGKAPIEITFRQDVRGVSLDARKSVLRLQPEGLREEATRLAVAALSRRANARGKPRSAEEALAEYVRETAPLFERLTGRKATGVPVWVSVRLIARDADLQIAETERGLFVEVPLAELKKKAETIRAEAPAVPEITFDPRMPPTIEDLLRAQIQLQTKMNRMERQLAELQRSIDRLNRLLEKKEDEKR